MHGDSVIRNTRRIVYFKPNPNARHHKTSDTTVNINITVHKHGNRHGDWGGTGMNNNNGTGNSENGLNGVSGSPDQLNLTHFIVSPNPGQGQYRVTFSVPEISPFDMRITDMTGKTIWQEHNNDQKTDYDKNIDISGQQKGVYILEIKQNDKTQLKKLVLN